MSTNENNPEASVELPETENQTTSTNETQVLPADEDSNELVIDDTPVEPSTEVQVKTDVTTDSSVKEETAPVAKVTKKALQQFDINHRDKLEYVETIALPSDFDEQTRTALDKAPNIDMIDTNEGREWASIIAEGLENTTSSEVFVETLQDENASFGQQVEHNNIPLFGGVPKLRPIENQNLKGERSVIRMLSHLGLGTLFQVPLWHTGMWITFKPPSEAEIIEINRVIQADKIKLGRYTYGLAFSNITSYTIDRLIEFALNHVYDTTLKNEEAPISSLRSIIASQDIPSLLWGFVCTMYPRGFNYVRSCVSDPEKCNHKTKDTLNVFKLQWTNENALTDWQKTHMSKRQPGSKDLASINRYKEELSVIQKRKIVINEGRDDSIDILIKSPSISEYVDAGHRWVGDIVETVNRALSAEARNEERNEIITKHGQASAMRQYSHWVDSIEIGSNVIDDLESIEKNLNVLSANDEIRSQFITEVVDYINRSTVSVIGIPVFDCPSCGTVQSGSMNLPHHTNVIPLDVIQVFFALLTQRLERMAAR